MTPELFKTLKVGDRVTIRPSPKIYTIVSTQNNRIRVDGCSYPLYYYDIELFGRK